MFRSFGVCDVIRGSEFARHLSALCTALGIDLQYGMPHNSRSQIERALRTIRQVVAKWQVEGTTEPLHVLVARTAREINCAPSDDQYAISPYEYLFGKSPPVPVIARYLDVDLTGIRATSNQYAVRESLERQAAVHAQLERVRHAQQEAVEKKRRDAERVVAEAARKKAAAERAAEDERLQSEVVECLERQFDKHGAAQVLVRRRNGTKAWLPQSDRMVPAQLLNDLTSKLRQQRIAMRGGGGQRVDTPRVTWATPLVYARREEEL